MKKVNILGDTPKQQWLNAIKLYDMVISSNLESAMNQLDSAQEPYYLVDTALGVLGGFRDEMKRLVEGVFEEE